MKGRKVIKGIHITLAVLFALFLAGVIAVVVIVATGPSLDDVSAEPSGYLTSVLDDSGETILTLAGTEANRIYADLDQIPDDLEHAVVAIEDERFYSHHGIDIKGIGRAIVKDITSLSLSQGASTITQQLIKNNVLTSWTEEDSVGDKVVRKVRELYMALVLEQRESKEWILENYLNTINLGGGTWGVEAASLKYFGKDVSELNLAECAVLAGITKSPTAYNPLLHPDKSRQRFELVLKKMLELGYITQAEYEEALADDVYERIEANHTEGGAEIFSYFEDELIEAVVSDLIDAGYTEEKSWDLIYRGGLTIYSTQNSSMQAILEEVINDDDFYADEDVQASIVLMDASSGAVKAIVGGRGEKTASLVYSHATDSIRQPGSTIKILGEYAAGLDTGKFTLGSSYTDEPTTYSDGTNINNSSKNYKGYTTVRKAIASSLNTVAYDTFMEVGVDQVWSYLMDFGLDTLSSEDKVEALALGGTSGGVTNLEMTAAYNAIAAGGIYREPYYYTQILDHDGNVLLSKTAESHRVISETTAALLTSAMEDVIEYGTGTDADFSGMAIAGKSGTTNDIRDAWFVGYSPYYTCGVWGGYDNNQGQDSNKYVKKIWRAVMKKVHADLPETDFPENSSLVSVDICLKCGKKAVSGLCDNTVQGDMTYTEYYVSGTQPVETCTCHEKVTICTDSDHAAGSYCPTSSRTTKVYLKEAAEGTLDEDYVLPSKYQTTCTTHTSYWDYWFNQGGSNGEDNSGSDNGYSGNDGGFGNGNDNSGDDNGTAGDHSPDDHNGEGNDGYGSDGMDWQGIWNGLTGGWW